MFNGLFSRDKVVLGVLILVLLGLISYIFFRFQLASVGLISAKQLYSGVQKSLNPSQANITLDKAYLKLGFEINPADAQGLEIFLRNIGVDNPGDQEINIKLNDQTADYLNKLLLKNYLISENSSEFSLNLRILSKEIDFDNKKIFGPFDSSAENILESPSSSGSIKTQIVGEQGYLIEIENPEKVLSESTLSGKLKLSDKLIDSGWWQVLTKIAKIKLKIEDGALSGAIFLK